MIGGILQWRLNHQQRVAGPAANSIPPKVGPVQSEQEEWYREYQKDTSRMKTQTDDKRGRNLMPITGLRSHFHPSKLIPKKTRLGQDQ